QNLRFVNDFIQRLHSPRLDIILQLTKQVIELARLRIAFDLLFPIIQIGRFFSSDTIPELLTLLRGQVLNLLENLFYGRAHNDTSTTSVVSRSRIGPPCFFSLSRRPRIAARIFTISSSRVFPWEMQPGKAGHSATNTPSSS